MDAYTYPGPPPVESVRRAGVLRIGSTGDYRPLSYFDRTTGRYTGFDAALGEDLARSLGVRPCCVPTSWSALTHDLLRGRYDIALTGVSVTEERMAVGLMSDGYLTNGKTILCRAEYAARFGCLADVDRGGVTVMVNPGGTNEAFAREHLCACRIVVCADNARIPTYIAEGRADLMLTETAEAACYARLIPGLSAPLLDRPFTDTQLGILMPKGARQLQAYVNDFLRAERESGRLGELKRQYLF